MGLAKYKAKRDFSKTSEPKGAKPLPKRVRGASHFVIQKHAARRLHYDFRLEMDGVLRSWALPKGLPWARGEKHLAVEVEDHPVDYGTFEGVIPEGQYGGGSVMLWDHGTYYVYGEQPVKAWKEGKVHLVLDGEKARGEWTLVRIRGRDGEKNQWLILKTGADARPPSKKLEDQSVKSGRTMKQIAADHDAEWESNRESDPSPGSAFKARIKAALKNKEENEIVGQARRLPKSVSGNRAGRTTIWAGGVPGKRTRDGFDGQLGELSLPDGRPQFIDPMKPKLLEKPPRQGDWLYELKFDGIRALAVKKGNQALLLSRNDKKLNARFPEIVDAVKSLPLGECVIDGEVVALDEQGRSSFQLLQAREMLGTGRVRPIGGEKQKAPLRFYVFDLLQMEGKSLIKLPLVQRKELLAKLCENAGDAIRYSGEIGGNVETLLAEVKRRHLEGLVGKQRHSVYEPGRRSGAWIKLKCVNEQEFVIGGYTPPAGARQHFGAILVGYFEHGQLMFAGKVGTGFTGETLSTLHKKFQKAERGDCPFANLPSKEGGQWTQGITPSMMRKMHWIDPILVAQIKFAEWTRDKKLRAPVFLGLREDKKARDVTRKG
jgi:bifunctional non-homologous end joining protein LigD